MDNGHIVKYPYSDWGMQIKFRLNNIGRTQKWLADALKITPTYLSDMMKGKMITSDHWKSEIERLIGELEKSA